MYGYVYLTTNLITKLIYVGQHKASKFEPNKYIGSGFTFKAILKQYTKKNFKCELLEQCDTKEALDEREKYWIKKLDAKNPLIGYNISDGGQCYHPDSRTIGFKNKVSNTIKGQIGVHFGDIKTKINPSQLNDYLAAGYELGWVDTKNKYIKKTIGNAKESKYMFKDGNYIRVAADCWQNYLNDGWIFKGKPHKLTVKRIGHLPSQETRLKLSNSHKGKSPTPEAIKKQADKLRNRIAITKNNKKKLVTKEELDLFLASGWVVGSLKLPNSRSKVVICYETDEHFQSIAEANRAYPKSGALKRCLKADATATCCGLHWYYEIDLARKEELQKLFPKVNIS